MVKNGSIDAVTATIEESREKAERLVDVKTIKYTDAREIGAECVCLQAIRELEINKSLKNEGWSEMQINTTLAHLITRTIYSLSELKSMRIMDENSAVCELASDNQEWRPGFQSIYKVAPSLYELKDKLESHLCQKTDDLFNITNRIAIFDLTNFYLKDARMAARRLSSDAPRRSALTASCSYWHCVSTRKASYATLPFLQEIQQTTTLCLTWWIRSTPRHACRMTRETRCSYALMRE